MGSEVIPGPENEMSGVEGGLAVAMQHRTVGICVALFDLDEEIDLFCCLEV